MNPCRCGYLGDPSRECARAPGCGQDYLARLSGPLLDRMDIVIEIQPIPATELARAPVGERTAAVAARVAAARERARARGGARCNAEAGWDELQPTLDADALALLETASARLRLSTRGQVRALRVARTIADLARAERVARTHVAEALSYRHRIAGRAG
jgi:magnesium chelatase family protein